MQEVLARATVAHRRVEGRRENLPACRTSDVDQSSCGRQHRYVVNATTVDEWQVEGRVDHVSDSADVAVSRRQDVKRWPEVKAIERAQCSGGVSAGPAGLSNVGDQIGKRNQLALLMNEVHFDSLPF
jgi:hypothetical protein